MTMRKNLENIEDIYRLSPLQEVMLFQTLYAPGSGVFLEQVSFPLVGPINLAALREKARFIRVSPAGQKEAAPHDVVELKTGG